MQQNTSVKIYITIKSYLFVISSFKAGSKN